MDQSSDLRVRAMASNTHSLESAEEGRRDHHKDKAGARNSLKQKVVCCAFPHTLQNTLFSFLVEEFCFA